MANILGECIILHALIGLLIDKISQHYQPGLNYHEFSTIKKQIVT